MKHISKEHREYLKQVAKDLSYDIHFRPVAFANQHGYEVQAVCNLLRRYGLTN